MSSRNSNAASETVEESSQNERDPDAGEPRGLEPAKVPHANASNLLADAFKDHRNILRAVLYEFGQNAIDALLWSISEGHRENDECEIYFRVNTDENSIEMWDSAIGMNDKKLAHNYLSIGEPGLEKNPGPGAEQLNTGGSQGKGFWAICGWGEQAYIETHTKDGERWSARAYPRRADQVSEIRPPDNNGEPAPRRPELDNPGVYLRLEGIPEDSMDDLADSEKAIESLEKKFAFAISNPAISVEFKYEVDGDVHQPEGYDFKNIVEEAAVVNSEDLPAFYLQNKDRQLQNLTLVKTEDLPDGFEPPWQGVAMLKGGEYVIDTPYMMVWPYSPQNTEPVRNGELWGWVDASELCPDQEEHAHTGFLNQSRIYRESGLKDRILEVADEEFDSTTVEDDTEAAELAEETVREYMDQFDPDSGTNTTTGGRDTFPDEPTVYASTGQRYFDEGDDVPFYVMISNPEDSGIENVHIDGELQQVIDSDGNEIPEEERGAPVQFADTGAVPLGVNRHRINDEPPSLKRSQEGGWRIELEMKQMPDVESGPESMSYKMALNSKPVRDETSCTFYVGDVEPESSGTPRSSSPSGAEGLFDSIGFHHKPDSKERAGFYHEEGETYLLINDEHPEFKALENSFRENGAESPRSRIASKWGFLRLFIGQAETEIKEMLEENHALDSEIGNNVENIVADRLAKYDEFCHDYSDSNPLN